MPASSFFPSECASSSPKNVHDYQQADSNHEKGPEFIPLSPPVDVSEELRDAPDYYDDSYEDRPES